MCATMMLMMAVVRATSPGRGQVVCGLSAFMATRPTLSTEARARALHASAECMFEEKLLAQADLMVLGPVRVHDSGGFVFSRVSSPYAC